ncbi:MAG: alpha/beta hydrolase, partial [Sphingomonadaceae bacterium]|nr:alpha/beta hydrolase [Sphingomonadaceae bacterium]
MADLGADRLEISLLGELALRRARETLALPASRKTRALLVYLLLAGVPQRRERLCEVFFDIPDDPRAALRWSLTKIRGLLGDRADLLSTSGDTVALDAEGFALDTDRLRREPARAEVALALESPLAGLDLPALESYSAWLGVE